MEAIFDPTVSDFLKSAEDLLLSREAANGLPLGICANLLRGTLAPTEPPIFLRIVRNGTTSTVALRTPPHPLILTFAEEGELELLASELHVRGHKLPAVSGPANEVDLFTRIWCRKTGQTHRVAMNLRLHELTQVKMPPLPGGSMRAAAEQDIPLVGQWLHAFGVESLPHEEHSLLSAMNMAEKRVRAGDFFVWERNGEVVTMAGLSGPTKNGIRINGVYTPKQLRKQGFATALVALLSQRMLDSGRRFCVLYTDLMNPVSNSIYQKVGYEPVMDSKHMLLA